jgi:anti-sigma factor RsiW
MDDSELDAHLKRATRHKAGEPLQAAVRTQLALLVAARPGEPVQARAARRWPTAVAGMLAGAVLTAGLLTVLPHVLPEPSWAADVVAGHVRSLGAGPLIEVASGDRHTVKPWFQGKVDFAPAVPDLADEGYPLLGGRVDRIAGHTAAALAYQRRLHVINVFIFPGAGVAQPRAEQLRGFHLVHWSDGTLQTWLVSDMDAAELTRFSQLWRSRSAANADAR